MEQNPKPDHALDASTYTPSETPAERVFRLYGNPGGPLVGWVLDDASRRRHSEHHVARELGITLEELRLCSRGQAKATVMSRAFITRAARYLAIPPITARVLVGDIRIGDFATRVESPAETIEREYARLLTDPQLRALIPQSLADLTPEYQEFLVAVYGRTGSFEWAELPRLPEILRWLQRAAIQHDEHEGIAAQATC
uniref:Uncharacterized protein n=1 Tax=mine drainage metagenome TaxID=410659 RepID=E6PTF4_9ZZZZ